MLPMTALLHKIFAFLVMLSFLSSAAYAVTYTLTYMGSWRVDSGKNWSKHPLAYTGQEAAALLFGGVPSDYLISTNGHDPSNIDYRAWYSVIGVSLGHKLRQNYDVSVSGGRYYDGAPYDNTLNGNAASAYVQDNAIGAQYTNYAFRLEPIVLLSLPESFPTMIGAFGVLFVSLRLRVRAHSQ